MFIKNEKDSSEFVAGDGTNLKEILHPSNHAVDINYSIAQARIKPQEASLPHRLKGSETYYVLSGAGEIHINGEVGQLTKGSIAFVPPNAEQFVRNTGKEDLIFLCIVEPYWREEDEEV